MIKLPSNETFKTQLRKTTTSLFLCCCCCLFPAATFFTCMYHTLSVLTARTSCMNWVFVFGRMTCDATVAFNNNNNHNIEAKSRIASWTFCICFHRIDLIWSHTHEFISNARPLSHSPAGRTETFSRICFCILLNRVQKTHIVHFDASVRRHSVRASTNCAPIFA